MNYDQYYTIFERELTRLCQPHGVPEECKPDLHGYATNGYGNLMPPAACAAQYYGFWIWPQLKKEK